MFTSLSIAANFVGVATAGTGSQPSSYSRNKLRKHMPVWMSATVYIIHRPNGVASAPGREVAQRQSLGARNATSSNRAACRTGIHRPDVRPCATSRRSSSAHPLQTHLPQRPVRYQRQSSNTCKGTLGVLRILLGHCVRIEFSRIIHYYDKSPRSVLRITGSSPFMYTKFALANGSTSSRKLPALRNQRPFINVIRFFTSLIVSSGKCP